MRQEERGPWYLITALIIGVTTGLFIAWVVSPVEYIDTEPAALRADFKDEYRALIAAAFSANGDLVRAQHRLALLGEENSAQILTLQAQRAQEEGQSSTYVHNLSVLAMALERGLSSTPIVNTSPALPTTPVPISPPTRAPTETAPSLVEAASPTPTEAAPAANLPTLTPTQGPLRPSATPTPSLSPTIRPFAPTITPLPTRTATPTQGAPFVLKQEVALICSPVRSSPLIMVEAQDSSGMPIPGVQVLVYWQGGEDRFYTGLKPEMGKGYADFTMQPGVTYTVQLAEGGQPVSGLTANECEGSSRERHWGAWKLTFSQP
jgi:hypothetical protein